MIRKLTIKNWMSTGVILLFCIAMAVFPLWKYGPSALEALQGSVPGLAGEESMSNIYGLSALGLFFALLSVAIIVRQLTNSVGRRVKRYLAGHPEITMQQLDDDFAAAEEAGNVWIGKRWTFSHDLNCILVENARIAWVYSEKEHSRRNVYYYLCLGLADGSTERIKVSRDKLSRMHEIYEGYPHILVGDNPEYGYLFRNDINSLLNIKYRRNA